MKAYFLGMSHLGQTLMRASEIRGIDTHCPMIEQCDLVFVTIDVEDHSRLDEVNSLMRWACDMPPAITVVLVSQVPPGYTRPWLAKRKNIFVQVDTIIMNRALERAAFPDRFIVGCEDPSRPLPKAYERYLEAFNCPIITMGIESAELSKLAINYYLNSQIDVANKLSRLANAIGADWNDMVPGLRLDDRIGKHAYIRPGKPNEHLLRDIRTIERMLEFPAAQVENA